MRFSHIRLSGFKSFVDPTELRFEEGLTGVVGPNGCGKSNILEAIRWVMGENSAKSLRGGGMDDVIFSGTDRRPSRNLAEVSIFLDNSSRTAPSAFNNSNDLEISRRIERDSGSAYRINGGDVRAKDVQLLFADAATGAHSPALVSQGRISSIIEAKPKGRRVILEEAAGITGLYSRRKEAESRLKSAETNLLRLQDVMIQMESQMASLRRQARQAKRYKNISGDLRRAEGTLLFVKWRSAGEKVSLAEKEFKLAQSDVANLTTNVSFLNTEHAKLSHKLPDLRHSEVEKSAALHRLSVAKENLDQEANRLATQKTEMKARLSQITSDRTREEENSKDAFEALKNLTEELEQLAIEAENEKEREQESAEILQTTQRAASSKEEEFDKISSQMASVRAKRESIASEQESLKRRVKQLDNEKERIEFELHDLIENDEQLEALNTANKQISEKEASLNKALKFLEEAENTKLLLQNNRDGLRNVLNAVKADLSGIDAEINALNNLIMSNHSNAKTPVAETLKVKSGFELAIGAALGDDLDAPLSNNGSFGWKILAELDAPPSLPKGVIPLSDVVTGSDVLKRRLSQTGLLKDGDGLYLMEKLKPGQRLVSPDGALWRWDGFVRTADVMSLSTIRLQQKNRIEDLKKTKAKLSESVAKAESKVIKAEDDVDRAIEKEREARKKRSDAELDGADARKILSKTEKEGSERTKRLAALQEGGSRVKIDYEAAQKRLMKISSEISKLPNIIAAEKNLNTKREEVEKFRTNLAEARTEFDSLARIRNERESRRIKIIEDKSSWESRVDRSKVQINELDQRTESIKTFIIELEKRPDEIETKKRELLTQLKTSENARQEAADKLASAEKLTLEKDSELKLAQELMSGAREGRVRIEANLENTLTSRADLIQSILEKFECPPQGMLDKIEVKNQENLPELDALERRLERLKVERERLGAVNLRADIELQELDDQVIHLTSEKSDLEKAIRRLRQAIGELNREGRERMLTAFEKVNSHFTDLFTSLFGGGHAHLKLIESDDPLDAGLEIMASPPGKKLQSLSLLSGGEQALTALSLIFAVFMTNPAPICVLDEVDAPLDDANVERFCNLLDNITSRTETRFLIVTHNAVTMSRMNRLFGVTMAERGVSQLVSVDLEMAEKLQAVG